MSTPIQLGVARMPSSPPIASELDVTAGPSAGKTISPTSARITARTALKALISVGLTVAVFYLVFSRSYVPSFDVFLTRFSAKLFLVVIALSAVATALSAWRLKLIAQDLGYRLSIRDSIAALSLGLLAGTMFFQLIGQLMARGALLSRRGMPSMPTRCIGPKVRLKKTNDSQKWILPSVSSYIRPVIVGNQW